MFLVYVNDINNSDLGALIRLFADDTNIFVCSKDINSLKTKAEDSLAKIANWFKANKLTVNISKTCFSVFSNKRINIKHLNFDGHTIERTETTKYLGMFIDEKLSWSQHIDFISKKLLKLSHAMKTLSKFIDNDMSIQLYYAYVYPHITYGIELYGTACQKHLNRLKVMHNRILKTLCSKPRRYSSIDLYNDVNLLTIENIHKLFTNIFVYKQRNGLLPVIFNEYYKLNSEVRTRITRQDNNIYVPRFKSTIGLKSIKVIGANLWNNSSINIKSSNSLHIFKKLYREWLMENQKISLN